MLHTLAPYHQNIFIRFFLSQTWILTIPGVMSLLTWVSPLLFSFFRTTQSVTLMQGGTAPNVIPYQASAVINFRLIHGDTCTSIMKHVENVLIDQKLMNPHQRRLDSSYSGDTIVIENPSPGSAVDPSPVSLHTHDSFSLLKKAIKEHYVRADNCKPPIVTPSLMVAGTDTKHYSGLSEQIYRFSPLEFTKDDVNRLHGVNERVGVVEFSQYIDFFIRILLELNV